MVLFATPTSAITKSEYDSLVQEAASELRIAQQNLQNAQHTLQQLILEKDAIDAEILIAQQVLENAELNYQQSQIQDPNWIRPTKEIQVSEEEAYIVLVPYTEIVYDIVVIESGLLAKIYNMIGYNSSPPLPTEDRLVSTQIVGNINFNWGGGQILNSGLYEDAIVKFTGYINIPLDGSYGFYAPGDDGVMVIIDNEIIINDWFDKGGGGSMTSKYLTAGQHEITVWFYENGGGANVWLYWAKPGYGWEIVPASAFGSETQLVPREVVTYTEETHYRTVWHTEVVPDEDAVHPMINDPQLLEPVHLAQEDLLLLTLNRDNKALEIEAANQVVLSEERKYYIAKQKLESIDPYVEPVVEPTPEPTPEVTIEPVIPAEPEEKSDEEIMAELLAEAQEDDLVVSEELAAIPVVGAVAEALVEALNFFGNAGADMTPEVREKAEKVVVAALVAGQVAQVATTASAGAAAAATRRIK